MCVCGDKKTNKHNSLSLTFVACFLSGIFFIGLKSSSESAAASAAAAAAAAADDDDDEGVAVVDAVAVDDEGENLIVCCDGFAFCCLLSKCLVA